MKSNLEYRNDKLFLEDVDLESLVEEYGSPLYVYSADTLKNNIRSYREAFEDISHMICYAVKANYNGNILKIMSEEGAGADVVSGGELYMAIRAGISPEKIVFAGVGKSEQEIKTAIKNNIYMINVESEQELEKVNKIALGEGKSAKISLRINPDIDPKTHPKIATGLEESKFGISGQDAVKVYKKADRLEGIAVRGVHLHIGSQITDLSPFELSAKAAVEFADKLKAEGIELDCLDIGGGLGISYEDQDVPSPRDMARILKKYFKDRSEKLILEPGRSLVGNAGFLLTKINYVKKREQKNFVVVDAGFNDFLRPALYGAFHEIRPVEKTGEKLTADVVGPVCETGDYIALERELSGVKQGNTLAVLDAGAYGFSMSSNYNSRPRAGELLIEDGSPRLIRRREVYKDLIDTEL
ncbi:MAG: diaminopimelate decarboxylase [Elusimicrobiota bacterium]